MDDMEKLVELVTAEVLRRLQQPQGQQALPAAASPQQALVIFTGGSIGLEPGLEELQTLQSQGIAYTVVLSKAAETIVGESWIKEKLGNDIPVVTASSPYPGKYLRQADIVLVPVLTQNTAAKLAHTLADTLVTTLILQALMLGKPVIAAKNAADPQDGWRIQKSMNQMSPALYAALENNLKKIESYGITLTPVAQLAAAAQQLLGKSAAAVTAAVLPAAKKQVLDAAFFRQAANSGTTAVRVARGSIITPLARDVAGECHIELIWE